MKEKTNNPMKLNFGCGNDIKDGWINQDMAQLPGVDVVHDLRVFPWPFKDNQFEIIYLKDVLEHLPDTIKTMEELYRIAKSDAEINLTVPYWNSVTAFGDPTHIRSFNEFSFNAYDPNQWLCKERSYYTHARFKIINMNIWIIPFWPMLYIPKITRDYLIKNRMAKNFLLKLANLFSNIIHTLDFTLIKVEKN